MNNLKIRQYIRTSIVIVFSMMLGSIITMFLKDSDIKSENCEMASGNSYSEFEPLYEAYERIKGEYYEKTSTSELVDGAITGMLNSLGDKHTMYFNKDAKTEFEQELSGSYFGIGAEIQLNEDKTVSIKKIFDESPAEKAGLKVNDIFISIDGKSTEGKNASEVANMLKSSKIKTSTIVIKRDNEEKTIKVKKENITLFSVNSEMMVVGKKKIGYIGVNLFGQKTYDQFSSALNKLEKDDMDSLIIDLRGNSGGYLTTVTQMLSIFFDRDTVIYKMKTKDKIEEFKSIYPGQKKYKVLILIDENSASASEIMAGAMKEKYGATLVGKTTYGKGTVQSTADLSDGTMIKYTIQEWLTPNGESVTDKGIKPDYEVDLSEEYKKNPNNDNDDQLKKALELLK